MTKQEKQMLKSVRMAIAYSAGTRRMKKVYRDLYPRIKARKRVQLINQGKALRQMDKALSFGLRYCSTPQSAVSIYEGFLLGDFEAIGGTRHETH